jgi:hypothetical protein
MTWDYRIVKDKEGFSIREVYYDETTEAVVGWTQPLTLDKFETPNDAHGMIAMLSKMRHDVLVLPEPVLGGLEFIDERPEG